MNDETTEERIYLDNAATSWPKPESVYQAMDRYQREIGVAAGRGSYRSAEEVDRTVTQLRRHVLQLLGARQAGPEHCIFTQNCTDSLNLVLHGLLRSGDHVVTTELEHNSIARPLQHLRSSGINTSVVGVDEFGVVDLDALRRTLVENTTRLIAITHASNVTGAVQPIAEIGRLAKESGALLLVDAAQTAGHVPIDVESQNIDFLAAPGHKGLLGPLGTGLLYLRPGVEAELSTIRQGGTGTSSETLEQPESLPSKYEAGNANVPGLYGLLAGVQFVLAGRVGLTSGKTQNKHEANAYAGHESGMDEEADLEELTQQTIDGLKAIEGVDVFSYPNRCGIVSFNVRSFDPREVAAMLDGSARIEVRAGLHCAPGIHRRLGTFSIGGCVRASFGQFSRPEHASRLIEAVSMLVAFAP